MLRRLAHAASTKHQYAKSGFGFEASRQLWPGSSRPVMRRTVNGELTNAAQRCDSPPSRQKSRLCRATATIHRADFEQERERAERLAAEVLKATADTMAVKEATAWLEGALAALR
jgi:hypothetical protein